MSTAKPRWRDDGTSRRSSIVRSAVAVVAIMFVGMGLVLLFQDVEKPATSGAGDVPDLPHQILVSWDPNGGEDYKLFSVHATTGEISKLTPGRAEVDGISERFASWSPGGQRVVFVREEGGKSDIHVMGGSTGTELINLTNDLFRETQPMWSPDGSQIVWVSSSMEQREVANIHVVNADGSDRRQLTHLDTGAFSPAWSPDGTQIAYVVRSMDFLQVWIMEADGSNAHAITEIDDSFTLHEPFISPALAWSPDGTQIAFSTGSAIRTVNVDTLEVRDITDEATIATSHPAWSPDGLSLAFLSEPAAGGDAVLTIVDPDGTRTVTGVLNYTNSPVWSPDGQQIAWLGTEDTLDENTERPWSNVDWSLQVTASDGPSHRTLVGPAKLDPASGLDWRPRVQDDVPPSLASPTPLDPPIPTPEILTEPPRVTLIYENQTQTHGAHSYCWPMSPDGEVECAEADRGPPDLPAIHVPAGASLSFQLEGDHAFTPLGAAAVRLIPYPEPSTIDLTFDFPGTGLAFEQGPDGTVIVADVPDGDYSFEIGITMEVFPGLQGDASYAFRVFVGDPEAPPPEEPEKFEPVLTYEGQTHAGIFSYGCSWEGDPVCVDPGGLLFPTHALNVPEGATMQLTFTNPADIELVGFDGRIHLTDGVEIGQFGTHSELSYPTPYEETPIIWGSLENLNVVADLPPGHYALAVTYHAAQGSGTYGFHINVVSSDAPWQDADTIGTIEQIEERDDGRSVYIIEHPEDPNAGDQYYVSVTEQTPVFERTADGVVRRTAADLQPGMRLTVAFLGEVAESYPAYANAAEVVIVRTETDGPADPDDLVTMTFRHDLITGFAPIPAGDAFYVAYSIVGGASGEVFLCADHERAEKPCTSGYVFERTIEVPRGAELTFTVYRLSRDNPDIPEVVKQGREIVDGSMITRSWYRYGASNPGGY